MKRLAASLYLISGLASAFICYRSLMWAVWGAPTNWTEYVGLLSSLTVAVGALMFLISGQRGQVVCVVGAAGMGCFYIPAVEAAIPAADSVASPLNYLILAGYPVFLAAVMLYPRRFKGAGFAISGIVLAMGVWAGVTTVSRWKDGEFNRPQLIGFTAAKSTEPLVFPRKYASLFSAGVRNSLAHEEIGGLLRWRGSFGADTRQARLVVVATSPIDSPRRLPYPKNGAIVYLWNGERWSSFPKGTECYPAFAILNTDGMIGTTSAMGSETSVRFFLWPKP